MEDIVQAHQQGVELFVPPKPARNPENRGHELEPEPSDAEAIRARKQRMASEEGQKIYQQRAATSKTANADLPTYRGLVSLTVRGLDKIKCVALWCALAYNLTPLQQSVSQLKPRSKPKTERIWHSIASRTALTAPYPDWPSSLTTERHTLFPLP